MSGTYIQDKTRTESVSESLIQRIDGGYSIKLSAFSLKALNPYRRHFSDHDSGIVYISYLYYGNNSLYERRRQEFRKYIDKNEVDLIIKKVFKDEKGICERIEKKNHVIINVFYSKDKKLNWIEQREKLIANIKQLQKACSDRNELISQLRSEIAEKNIEINRVRDDFKNKIIDFIRGVE